jgi:hypothetical protein
LSTYETNSPENRPDSAVDGGVLAALPRTRPQRASPRRAAARQRAGKAQSETADQAPPPKTKKTKAIEAKAIETTSIKATPSKAKTTSPKAKASSANPKIASSKKQTTSSKKPVEPSAPKQGYEPEEEVELGKTVNPPSGVELVESVADIFGELANSSLAAGGRILKDAFSLLRRP